MNEDFSPLTLRMSSSWCVLFDDKPRKVFMNLYACFLVLSRFPMHDPEGVDTIWRLPEQCHIAL